MIFSNGANSLQTDIVILWYCDIVILWYCDIVILIFTNWYCDRIAHFHLLGCCQWKLHSRQVCQELQAPNTDPKIETANTKTNMDPTIETVNTKTNTDPRIGTVNTKTNTDPTNWTVNTKTNTNMDPRIKNCKYEDKNKYGFYNWMWMLEMKGLVHQPARSQVPCISYHGSSVCRHAPQSENRDKARNAQDTWSPNLCKLSTKFFSSVFFFFNFLVVRSTSTTWSTFNVRLQVNARFSLNLIGLAGFAGKLCSHESAFSPGFSQYISHFWKFWKPHGKYWILHSLWLNVRFSSDVGCWVLTQCKIWPPAVSRDQPREGTRSSRKCFSAEDHFQPGTLEYL